MKVLGKLKVDIFKHDPHGGKVLIDSREGSNLVVNTGKQLICYLLAGEPGNHVITKFGVGENGSHPVISDTGLTNAFIDTVSGSTLLAPTVVQWDFVLGTGDANGLTVSEFGLYSQDEQLFARKIRLNGEPVLKDNSISMYCYWTVWLLECKKTTFSSYPSIVVDLKSDITYGMWVASQADIVTNLDSTSDYFDPKEFASAPVIQANITSDAQMESVFYMESGYDDGFCPHPSSHVDFEPSMSQVHMGYSSWVAYPWFRFPIPLAKDTVVNTARLYMESSHTQSKSTVLRIYFEDVDDAVQLAGAVGSAEGQNDYWSRVRTVAYVDWTPESWVTTNWHYTADFSTLLNAQLARGGWSAGNHIQIFMAYQSGASQSSRICPSQNYQSGAVAPRLVVT